MKDHEKDRSLPILQGVSALLALGCMCGVTLMGHAMVKDLDSQSANTVQAAQDKADQYYLLVSQVKEAEAAKAKADELQGMKDAGLNFDDDGKLITDESGYAVVTQPDGTPVNPGQTGNGGNANTGDGTGNASMDYGSAPWWVSFDDDGRLVYHIVKGDTLSKISNEVHYSVDELAEYNKINNVNLIYAGSSLRIPFDVSEEDRLAYEAAMNGQSGNSDEEGENTGTDRKQAQPSTGEE